MKITKLPGGKFDLDISEAEIAESIKAQEREWRTAKKMIRKEMPDLWAVMEAERKEEKRKKKKGK